MIQISIIIKRIGIHLTISFDVDQSGALVIKAFPCMFQPEIPLCSGCSESNPGIVCTSHFHRKGYIRLPGYHSWNKMAAHNTRARAAAVIILLIAGICVIAASAALRGMHDGTHGYPGKWPCHTPTPVIYVEAGTRLQYLPNLSARTVANCIFTVKSDCNSSQNPVIPFHLHNR